MFSYQLFKTGHHFASSHVPFGFHQLLDGRHNVVELLDLSSELQNMTVSMGRVFQKAERPFCQLGYRDDRSEDLEEFHTGHACEPAVLATLQ